MVLFWTNFYYIWCKFSIMILKIDAVGTMSNFSTQALKSISCPICSLLVQISCRYFAHFSWVKTVKIKLVNSKLKIWYLGSSPSFLRRSETTLSPLTRYVFLIILLLPIYIFLYLNWLKAQMFKFYFMQVYRVVQKKVYDVI